MPPKIQAPTQPAITIKPTPTPPKGVTVDGEITRCPACGSTDRLPYHRIVRVQLDPEFGVDQQGRKATHRVLKRTSCSKCGTGRTDNIFENSEPA